MASALLRPPPVAATHKRRGEGPRQGKAGRLPAIEGEATGGREELAGEAAAAPAGSDRPGSSREASSLPEPRVVVVSPDAGEADVVALALTGAGTKAVVASLQEAVSWDDEPAQAVDVFVVSGPVLDDALMMMLETLRNRFPTAEIVVVSPDPMVENAVQAVRSGVHSVLQAPAGPDQLGLEVAKALARRRWAGQRLRLLARTRRQVG